MSDPTVWTAQAAAPIIITDGMPATRIINAYQGDDFRLVYQLSILLPGESTPEEADLTGCEGLMQVREDADRDSTLIADIPFIGDNLADGWVTHYADHDLMHTMTPGTYWYDSQLVDADGVTRTWLRGPFIVTAEISTDEP